MSINGVSNVSNNQLNQTSKNVDSNKPQTNKQVNDKDNKKLALALGGLAAVGAAAIGIAMKAKKGKVADITDVMKKAETSNKYFKPKTVTLSSFSADNPTITLSGKYSNPNFRKGKEIDVERIFDKKTGEAKLKFIKEPIDERINWRTTLPNGEKVRVSAFRKDANLLDITATKFHKNFNIEEDTKYFTSRSDLKNFQTGGNFTDKCFRKRGSEEYINIEKGVEAIEMTTNLKKPIIIDYRHGMISDSTKKHLEDLMGKQIEDFCGSDKNLFSYISSHFQSILDEIKQNAW